MQMKLKTLENFADLDMKGILDNTVRLEVAVVKSTNEKIKEDMNVVGEEQKNEAVGIERSLMARLDGLEEAIAKLSFKPNTPVSKRRDSRPKQGGIKSLGSKGTRQCWNCGDKTHILRQCPKRFCQACGGRGHDAWEEKCQKSSR